MIPSALCAALCRNNLHQTSRDAPVTCDGFEIVTLQLHVGASACRGVRTSGGTTASALRRRVLCRCGCRITVAWLAVYV